MVAVESAVINMSTALSFRCILKANCYLGPTISFLRTVLVLYPAGSETCNFGPTISFLRTVLVLYPAGSETLRLCGHIEAECQKESMLFATIHITVFWSLHSQMNISAIDDSIHRFSKLPVTSTSRGLAPPCSKRSLIQLNQEPINN